MFTSAFKTAAAHVRTGHVISSPWSHSLSRLEVETVTHELFRSPEGVTAPVVRFTGWELFDGKPAFNHEGERIRRVIRGWGQRAEGHVTVHADLRDDRDTFGRLSGRADVAQLQSELDEFLKQVAAR